MKGKRVFFLCFLCLWLVSLPLLSNDRLADGEIQIILNDTQEKRYDRYHQYASDRSFDASLRIGAMDEALPIRAHIRGQGTRVRCDRKSFSLKLTQDSSHAFFEGSSVKGVYLLSMCQDRRYLRTNSIFTLWRELGFFPIQFRMVELRINQEHRGLYMMLEKPVDALLEDVPGLTAVLRRRFYPPDDVVEVKYATSSENLAIGDYVNAFLDLDALGSTEQVEALDAVLDLDQFIQHLAVATVLRNGDYVDEVWFYRALRQQRSAQKSDGYRMIKWDPDDVFHNCHRGGGNAWKDPAGIAYCAESKLSKIVLSNPLLYPRFIAAMNRLIAHDLAPARFDDVIDSTADLLVSKLTRTETVAVMEQFALNKNSGQVSDPLVEAHREIRQEASKLKQVFRDWVQKLQTKIRSYQSN